MIYFDNAATTKVSPAVRDAMLPYFADNFGNPSSIFYPLGSDARREMENARKTVADCLGCDPKEIYFTASGSEADNWAIKGVALKSGKKHIITSKIEHPSVLEAVKKMLDNIDVLVDGRFVKDLKSPDLLFRGSSNQRIINVKESIKEGRVIWLEGTWQRKMGSANIYE